jgi:trigger factor
MSEASCRRELELEIPAERVAKETERVAREFARLARLPGFRPGKAPLPLIRRRFASEIRDEVLEALVPAEIEQAVTEQKLQPVTRPQVDRVDFPEGGPVKFRAVFEVLPEFELGNYKELEIEVEAAEVTDEDVEKTLAELRERAAKFTPVEGRAAEDGDTAVMKLTGTPHGEGEPVTADEVLCHIGAEETLAAFTENLRGAAPGETRRFEMTYPDDFPDAKLAGKTYTFTAAVSAIKRKSLPELDDDFAREVSDAAALDELRGKVRANLEAARDSRQQEQARDGIIEKLVAGHDFPVPEALVEHQMDARLERVVRSLAAQGVDPRAVNVDWTTLRERQRERALADIKAELLLDRIATAEGLEVADEELDRELERLGEQSGESGAALRARLTKQGALDRMKSRLRSEKTLGWLQRSARIQQTAKKKET